MMNMSVNAIEVQGKAIVGATVHDVEAPDVLQAEYRAEKFLAMVAADNGEVVSCDRWEVVEHNGNVYSIKFHCS